MLRTSTMVTGLVIALAIVAVAGCMQLENQSGDQGDQAAAAASGTGAALPQSDMMELQGTVVHKDLEGGFFAIDGDDGRTYDPINLPEAFKRNGMRVKATVRVRDDVGSIHMIGDVIEIVDIAEQ